jgi:hypothetical protein
VLVLLGSTDAVAGLAQLNAKGLAIVDAVALRLRSEESGRRCNSGPPAGYVFECVCGASFGTRAATLEEAAGHAREHGWRIVILHAGVELDGPSVDLDVETRATCCVCAPEATGGGSSVPGLVEGGPAPRGERSSVHPVDQVLDAIDEAIETYQRWPRRS